MASQDESGEDRRRPRRLYATGTEPDARFTLANERTFLAWVRTALALMAAGVAVDAFNLVTTPDQQIWGTALAVFLIAAGMVVSAAAFRRWLTVERALRTGRPLPAPTLVPLLGYGLVLVGAVACVLLLTARW